MSIVATDFQIVAASVLGFSMVLFAGSMWLKGIHRGSYVLSTFHAVAMLAFTTYVIFIDCASPYGTHCDFNSTANNDVQQLMLLFSLGYFIVDSIVVLFLSPDYEAAFHHLTIVVGQIAATQTGKGGYALAWFLFLAELSAPFLNCFLSGLTIEGSKSDFVVRAAFAFTFIVARLLICPFMTYKFVFASPDAPFIPKMVCLCVMAISAVWGKRVVGATLDALVPKKFHKIESSSGRFKGE